MNTDQLTVILDRIDHIQKGLDRIDRDLGKDREDLQLFTLRLASVEAQVDSLCKSQEGLPDRMSDKVEDAIEPILKETQELKDEIKLKQFIVFEKRSWLNRLFRRGG